MKRAIAMAAVWAMAASGEVTRVHVVERSDVLGGRSVGAAGAYERIVAKAHFALDVRALQNRAIRDLELAPRTAAGKVEFSADLYVLKPRDPAKGNGTLLFEVSNRGGKGMLGRFMFARGSNDPRTEEEFGDRSLLEKGYTLVWLGWQWDVPEGDGKLLRLDAPVIEGVKGIVRAEMIAETAVKVMAVADRGHVPYAAVEGPATLTVRDTVLGKRRRIPGAAWRFNAARTEIEMARGFEPGRMYELVYTAVNPRVQGVGLAAVRDIVSFFKYSDNGVTQLGDQRRFIKRAIGFGVSQSGRFLRTLLYYGMNEDEHGRKVFDGVWADVAGAGRGSFNHRFAQASRDGFAFNNTLYQTDLFPFSDVPQPRPGSGESDGLLVKVRDGVMPKVFYTNGSWEYWNRCAALVHTSVDGGADAPLGPATRLYFVAGAQHGPNQLPRRPGNAAYLTNPNETRFLHRALLEAMEAWVRDGVEPPRPVYPSLAEDQLTTVAKLKWPKWTGVKPAERPKQAYMLNFGDEFEAKGIVAIEPPKVEGAFPVLVPQVDEDGLELGGIRLPVVAVPLGAMTGWNPRAVSTGAGREMAPTLGGFFPFPKAVVEGRYGSREEYLKRVGAAFDGLVKQRFVLERDREAALKHASGLWDFVSAQPGR